MIKFILFCIAIFIFSLSALMIMSCCVISSRESRIEEELFKKEINNE